MDRKQNRKIRNNRVGNLRGGDYQLTEVIPKQGLFCPVAADGCMYAMGPHLGASAACRAACFMGALIP